MYDTDLPGSAGEHVLQESLGTRDRAAKFYRDQLSDQLTPRMRQFIARMGMVWVATADGAGECDCSFRAGPPGFVRVLDDRQLAWPEYRGNGVMASCGNILQNPHVGLWFGDFEQDLIGLHVNGTATVATVEQMRRAGPALPEEAHPGRRPVHWVMVYVEECYIHCRKHLPRLVRQPRDRKWGSDSPLDKGGDYFCVAARQPAAGTTATPGTAPC